MASSRLVSLPLAGYHIDRDNLARARPALFDELWADESALVLPLWHGRALVHGGRASGTPLELHLLPVAAVPAALVRVYLGRTLIARPEIPAHSPVVATVLTDAAARELEPDEHRWVGLREQVAELSELDAGLFAEALAIANWHHRHEYCPHCGMPTVVEQGGWVRRCFEDDTEIFPRTDPAVIMGVFDAADRILLGSNAMWEVNRYSLLAGFVEPGESFESAVVREIDEEAGVRVSDVEYLGSQPWPFPASVMVGFRARLATEQSPDAARPDGAEIRSLRWFTRAEVRAGADGTNANLILPGRSSIARAIVDHWLGEQVR